MALDDFEWTELRRPATALHAQWQAEIDAFTGLLERLGKEGTAVLVSAMPAPNGDASWWSMHPGPEGSEALSQEVRQSVEAHHLHNIVWVWEPSLSTAERGSTRARTTLDDFYPGPLSADLILIDQTSPGPLPGWSVRMARELAGPKPVGLRTLSAGIPPPDFSFTVAAPGAAPISNASKNPLP